MRKYGLAVILIILAFAVIGLFNYWAKALGDDKDDSLTIANYNMILEREARLKIQLTLIDQQKQRVEQDLKDTQDFKKDLKLKVDEIIAKRKAPAPVPEPAPVPDKTPPAAPKFKAPVESK